ncbi:regucalcin-like [Montipora capricornis]|uniref:regucalcin-like n=1 Tax=Montipora foliosa TaxID=591990 RepID=UPI0035F181A0
MTFKMAAVACEISVVKERCAQLGEGPHWDESTRRLIWVDIFGQSVHLLDPITGKDEKYNFDGPVGAAVPRKKGGSLVVAAKRDFIFLDLETGKQEIVASIDGDKPGNRFNDGKCDPAGRFWAGSMGPEPIPTKVVPHQGSLYSLNYDYKVQSHVDKISISNGIAWDTGKRIFYHVDTADRKIDAFDYDETSGALFNRRTVINVDPAIGHPDGMTIDVEGMLWVAIYNGWKIIRYDPDTGRCLSYVDLPVRIVTSCCWAGASYDELIVTSESARLTAEEKQEQPLAGSIFRIKNLGTNGSPSVSFNG